MVIRYYIRKKRNLTKPTFNPWMITLAIKWLYQDAIKFHPLPWQRKENVTTKTIL